jgi:hypothetical protein
MLKTRVWVHLADLPGHNASRFFIRCYRMSLAGQIPGPTVPPQYRLLDWDASPVIGSTNLTVTNHGGPIDPELIAAYLQQVMCPSRHVMVTAGIFGTIEDSSPLDE